MAYIGTSPSNGVRRRFVYEATANQTSFSGNDESGITLTYVDSLYLDVFQNGIKLKAGDDYTATTGTTVVLVQGASADDVLEMVSFDVFSVNDSVSASVGGSFAGAIGMGSTLAVTGNTTVGGTLGVTGAVTLGTKLATTNLGTGAIVQVVNVVTTTETTGSTTIPHDDTIPQNTEGTEMFTLAITPTSSSNKLLILVNFQGACANAYEELSVPLFQDSTASCIAGASERQATQTQATMSVSYQHFMTAGTTSATTFKVRAGAHAGNMTMNDYWSTGFTSGMTIMEIAV